MHIIYFTDCNQESHLSENCYSNQYGNKLTPLLLHHEVG